MPSAKCSLVAPRQRHLFAARSEVVDLIRSHPSLRRLRNADQFTVVAFDHRQFPWSEGLVPASQQTIAAALAWVKQNGPQGGATDIATPLAWSLDLLNKASPPGALILPFVFLLTDGAVENERVICFKTR